MNALYETERLVFRLGAPEEAGEVARFYAENRDHLQPWSPTFTPLMFSGAYWREELARRRADLEGGRDIRGFLFSRERPDRVIGNLSFSNIARGVQQACVLGYSLAAEEQGRGYMTEAVRGAVAYAFGPLRLHRATAGYVPRNRRSAEVLRRAGFTVEGYARDFLFIDGRWEDHVLTAITNPNWRP